ncbi:MAG: hypothetical protein AB8B64_19085 [Granulosicoccus sp.]
MRQLSRTSSLTGVSLLVSLALVTGCGGSSDPATPVTPDSGDGGTPDVPVEGPAPETPLINATTARTIATESLELADTLVYVFSNASGQLANIDAGSIDCGPGSVAVTSEGTSQSFQLSDCALGGADLSLNGQMALDGAFNNGFTGSQTFTNFQIALGSRTISIDGTASVLATPGNTVVSAMELEIDDSQSLTTLSDSTLTIIGGGTPQQSVQMGLTAASPRFGLVGAQIESSGLNGQAVGCPQSGNLSVSTESSGSLVVNGAVGTNLMFTVDGNSDTLACAEVTTIVEQSTDVPLTPPPVPGGL